LYLLYDDYEPLKGGFGLYEEINKKLDLVLKLNQVKNQAVHKAWNTPYREIARKRCSISHSDRLQMVDKATRLFNIKVGKVYESINGQLENKGQPTINNPFLKGDIEE
jgi:hypothetical protein